MKLILEIAWAHGDLPLKNKNLVQVQTVQMIWLLLRRTVCWPFVGRLLTFEHSFAMLAAHF